MGCFSSRFDQRAKAYQNDFNTVGLAFIGGDKDHPYDLFPADRVSWGCDITKEVADSCPVEGLAATNETLTTDAYKKCFAALTAEHERLTKKYGSPSDGKVQIIANRYKSTEATQQVADTLAFLKEKSGISTEEAKADDMAMGGDDKPAEMMAEAMGEDMEGGDEMMEGEMAMGDGMMMDAMAMEAEKVNPHAACNDEGEFEGWANAPAALLRCMVKYPYVGDLVKQEALGWELNHAGAKAGVYTGLCGLLGAGVAKKQEGEAEFFLSGCISKDDAAAMKDITTGDVPLKMVHFPFLTCGWKTEDEARQALIWDNQDVKNLKDYTQVIFKVTGAKSMAFLGARQVASKINGTIDASAEPDKDGVTTYAVTAKAMDEKTVEQWKADVVAAAAAAKAAKDAKPEEMMMGDAMAEDKKEGEEMAEPMAMEE